MSGSRVPTVREEGGRYSVGIAPGVTLRWWFELEHGQMKCLVKLDAFSLKSYALIDVNADIISFPVQ
jgi:hypothetical protein